MSDDIHRTLGEHSAKLESMDTTISAIAADVKLLVANENKREGAKKVVYAIATALGAVSGSVAAKFLK